ncbi:MAG: alpha/beta hydrolase [Rhodobacteraceae bacterium]|nr:alpha/beta hydrolase [Paracoccaceae bacterium]
MRLDDAYSNGRYIAGAEAFPTRWAEAAAAFRDRQGARARSGLRYGTGERNWFDLFLPEAEPAGLCVFIHGGYWLAFGPSDFSHLAAGIVARGWACAMPAYTLAPKARIDEITREVAQAVSRAAAEVSGPIVVTGHSAGGHLSARMAGADIDLPGDVAARLARVVPISPLSDLRPLIETSMNADFRLDLSGARAESPALLPRRPGVEAHVWVGGDERPAFLDQARRLGNGWACPVTIDRGKHHFDVIEGLETSGSALTGTVLDGLSPAPQAR